MNNQLAIDPVQNPVSPARRSLFHSLRFQVCFVSLLSIAAPLSILFAVRGWSGIANDIVFESAIEVFVASVLSTITLSRFYSFPGFERYYYILPVVATVFGLLICFILIFRLNYSAPVVFGGLFFCLLALYLASSLRSRSPNYQYCLVPGGRVADLQNLPNFPHEVLREPCLPHGHPAIIVADLHHDLGFVWEQFLAEAAIAGIPVLHYKRTWEQWTGKVRIDHLSENEFGSLVPTYVYLKIKRTLDVVLCLLVLPLVLPLLCVVAALIRLDNKGPIFFRQERMGFRGRPFKILKLRTMHDCGEEESVNSLLTLPDDDRVSRLGRWLRTNRFDELPQIWNILRGEMSWIGPRPEALELSERYELEIPFYRYRHIVRPGISGWAQVNQGHVTSLDDVNTKLQFDFYYIKYFSYWIDLLILFRTLRVVAFGHGAK